MQRTHQRVNIVGLTAVATLLSVVQAPALAQVSVAAKTSAAAARRLTDGKPDLNGIWQALNTAELFHR